MAKESYWGNCCFSLTSRGARATIHEWEKSGNWINIKDDGHAAIRSPSRTKEPDVRPSPLCAAAILVLSAGWLSHSAGRFPASANGDQPTVRPATASDGPFRLLGAGSCASASCHNS